uniref:General transcription factor IIIC, polypeptide 4 n=2 Tax=Nothobranchius pienaari TaxID=704102 RepID=A0A1A8MXH3_9TELE
MAAAGVCESAPNNNINKTKPEREDTVTLSGSRDVPVGRDPVVSLLSPVSGLQPLSWSEDHRLAVGTCGSLTLLELLCDIHSNRQELTLHRTSIPVPTEAHRIRVGSPAEVAEAMEKFSTHPDPTVRQEFLADAVINPSVGARKGVKYSSWSPIGCDSTGCCLLACLTLDNRLTVHRSHKHLEWTTMVDVSKKYSERLKERGYAKKDNKPPEANLLDFDELQRRFRMQTPLRMEWSSVYSMTHVQQDNSCVNVDMVLLAVLMENGDLVLWKFSLPFTKGEDVEFYDLVESGVTRPSDLAWWEYENEDRRMSGLIIGSEVGPVKIMPVNLSKVKGYFTVRQPIVLWKECDEIPVENIKCVSLIHPIHQTSCSLIVASRGCYIFWSLLMISPAGLNVHNSHLAGLNSLPVVSLTVSRHSGTFYTCSTDGWVTKLTPKFTESSLVFTVDKLLQPEALTGSRIHGISVSHNGAYFALVGTQGLVGAFHPIRRTYKVHFLALKAPETAAVELLNSPTQNLYRGMDLLDLVRWNVLKNKCIPTQLQEELDRKIQELDTPYLWRLKLFLWRILHQSLHTPRVNHNWRPTPAEAVIVGPEAAEKEGELGKVKRKKEEERRAEVQSLIRTMETHLMRANIKKVLGVVYLNTWIAKNISIPTCGLMEYLSKDPNDRDSEVLIHHIRNKMNKQMFLERCCLCQAVLPFTDHKRAVCENGHMWHRSARRSCSHTCRFPSHLSPTLG